MKASPLPLSDGEPVAERVFVPCQNWLEVRARTGKGQHHQPEGYTAWFCLVRYHYIAVE